MKKILLSLLAVSMLVSSCGEKAATPTKEKMQIYLCIGQSNMAGSAEIEPCDTTCDARLLMMPSAEYPEKGRKMGEWYPGVPPQSSEMSGLSPADYFGRTMVELLPEDTKVGLITVAVGGCDIRMFDKVIYTDYLATYPEDWFVSRVKAYGNYPYARLIELAKKAQEDGVISGIILHQGETNTGDTEWPNYVKSVYDSILIDLNLKAEDVPLIAGEVVPASVGGKCAAMNPIIRTLPETIPTARVISGEGCGVRSDSVHYNSEGVRELGRRYAFAMLEEKGFLDTEK